MIFQVQKKTHQVIFKAPTNKIQIVYSLNGSTPVRSHCKYRLLELNKITFTEIDHNKEENFDETRDLRIQLQKELSDDEESGLERNLVWLFASPRSGTTWLGLELLSFQTHTMNEPNIGRHLGINRLDNSNSINAEELDQNPNYFFSKKYQNVWMLYTRKLILNRIYSQFRDLSKKIIVKEPVGSIGADIISQCLPHSKIIILIRDGRDIIDSFVDAASDGWMTEGRGLKIPENDRIKFIKIQAKRWLDKTKILLNTLDVHNKQLLLIIKYEELLINTEKELEKIYQFLDINITKKELKEIIKKYSFENIPSYKKGKGKFIRSATPGNWKKNLKNEEKKIVIEVMSESLKKLGYNDLTV